MFRSSVIHPPRVYDPGRSKQRAHLACHLGISPSPALESLIVSGRVPQASLTRRDDVGVRLITGDHPITAAGIATAWPKSDTPNCVTTSLAGSKHSGWLSDKFFN